MSDTRVARAFFAATSLLVAFGLVLQLYLSITLPSGQGSFESVPDRIVNFFSFFTVLSNLVVAVTTGMLAIRPHGPSILFRTLRLDGVVAIAVTGVVFHLVLSQLQELTRWTALADAILHTASPVLAVLGWVLFGPRGQLSPRVVVLAVIAPVAWIVYTLVRGAIVLDRFGKPFYPYPFMNVADHGYPVVLVNVALVAVLFLAVSFAALALDRHLPGVRTSPPEAAAPEPGGRLRDGAGPVAGQ